MALTCARCGAQNPDGNLYCQACGTPLAAAPVAVATPPPPGPPPGPPLGAPPGPPPGMGPPVFSPSGYQSPYYTPTGAAVQVHRTPWMLIIAAVVALAILMVGGGTTIAILGNRSSNTGGTIGSDLPSPTPGVTPSPVASPTPTTLGATTESNDGLTVPVPMGWSVASKDSEAIVLSDPSGEGSVTIASGASIPAQTAQDNKNTIDGVFKSKYPDTRPCPGSTTTASTFNGTKGLSWTDCFTLTSGSHSIPAAASLFVGANTSGSVYYVVMVLTRQDNLQNYLNVAKPVLQGVHWKLS